ncbi:MAG: transcriptional repressor LexA [Betaproteobacteria bacterium]
MDGNVGRLIRELRKRQGWSQEELAHKVGLTRQQIYRIEVGETGTKLSTLKKLAEVLGVPASEFLDADDRLPPLPPGAIPVGEMIPIPIIGTIRAGEPILAVQNIEGYCPVTADEVAGGEHFFLRVKGDSMIGARIQEGDLVLVRRQADVDDGDIAVVMVNDEEATIKRVYRENGKWLLKPENPAMRPFVVDKRDVQIIGKVVQIRIQLG